MGGAYSVVVVSIYKRSLQAGKQLAATWVGRYFNMSFIKITRSGDKGENYFTERGLLRNRFLAIFHHRFFTGTMRSKLRLVLIFSLFSIVVSFLTWQQSQTNNSAFNYQQVNISCYLWIIDNPNCCNRTCYLRSIDQHILWDRIKFIGLW